MKAVCDIEMAKHARVAASELDVSTLVQNLKVDQSRWRHWMNCLILKEEDLSGLFNHEFSIRLNRKRGGENRRRPAVAEGNDIL